MRFAARNRKNRVNIGLSALCYDSRARPAASLREQDIESIWRFTFLQYVTRARNRSGAAKQQIKKPSMACRKLKVRAAPCAITLSLCMNYSARGNGVPVAATIRNKQESPSTSRAKRAAIALGDFPEPRDNNATD